MDINCLAIDSQVCFHGQLFADLVKPSWCITGPTGPLGSTNQNWLCAKLLQWLSQSILWFMYIPVICWEHSTTVCSLMAVIARLRLATHAHHPTPLTHPSPISDICDITGPVKKLSQKPAANTARQS